MIYFLLLTAFTVSIDSLVCGFSLGKTSNKKLSVIVCVFTAVIVMCFITNYFALLLKNLSTFITTVLGAIILIFVGIYNLYLCLKNKPTEIGNKTFLFAGFAVGLDGAMANLSLALMGINTFYVPIIIALMHALMVTLGILLSSIKFSKKIEKYKFFAPIILIVLGLYKLLGILI